MSPVSRTNEGTRAIPRPARRAAIVVAAAGVALLAAACGASPAQTSTSRGAAAPSTQALAYANCIRSHGVASWPDPNRSGMFDKSKLTPQQLGVSGAQIAAAERACRSLSPNGPGVGPTQAQVQQYRRAMLQYARCMRAQGISDFPDPDSRGHLALGPGTPVNVNTPQFQAARQVCLSKLQPSPGSGGNG